MKCPNCRSDNFEYEKYCHICGTKLDQQFSSQNDTNSKKDLSKKDIFARLLLIVLFLATFLVYQGSFFSQFFK